MLSDEKSRLLWRKNAIKLIIVKLCGFRFELLKQFSLNYFAEYILYAVHLIG